MNDLASELCDGETLPLVLAFAQQHQFTANELARFREMIDSIKPTAKKRGGNERARVVVRPEHAGCLADDSLRGAGLSSVSRSTSSTQHLLWLVILAEIRHRRPLSYGPGVLMTCNAWLGRNPSIKEHHLTHHLQRQCRRLIEPRSVPFESADFPTVSAPSIEPSSPPADVLAVADNANEKALPITPTNWNPIVAKIAILAWFIGAIGCAFCQLRRLAVTLVGS